jgi:hypothetical protein
LWVIHIEVFPSFCGAINMFHGFLSGFLNVIAFPFNKVLEVAVVDIGIKDLINFVFYTILSNNF